MKLTTIDWTIIMGFFAITMVIGVVVSKKAGKNTTEFFLSGRSMPWWLLGISMVATTFSADTPNLVADIVRKNGVSGNWIWWAFLLTGMLTVFVYAKLWRRSRLLTDLEFYELRYSGREAAFLRGFRALYLGLFFNVVIIASVSLAAIKIGSILLNLTPVQTLLSASIVTVIYSSMGGLKGVLVTDFFQFIVALAGSVWATSTILHLPEVGGLQSLITHERVVDKLNFFPDFSNTDVLITVFVIPVAVQWWSVWYPGSEPGGGGYIAQRMLSAKDEKNAIWATLLFNLTHYALRPWPWILVALSSLVVFPNLSDIARAFPELPGSVLNDDLSYLAMLTYLPPGLLGLVVASLIAAFMSTLSTHLNWGSSYMVNDFYQRFVNPAASARQLVFVGRISTVLLMLLGALLALLLQNALQVFNILLQIGAGTGLIFILRWFWYRINAWSEITAMSVSFILALYFQLIHPYTGWMPLSSSMQLLTGILITSIAWIAVTLLTPPSSEATLFAFCQKIRPGGPGWKKIYTKLKVQHNITTEETETWDVPAAILCMVIGSLMVFATLFCIGNFIYGEMGMAILMLATAILSMAILRYLWKRLSIDENIAEAPDRLTS